MKSLHIIQDYSNKTLNKAFIQNNSKIYNSTDNNNNNNNHIFTSLMINWYCFAWFCKFQNVFCSIYDLWSALKYF